MSSYYNKESTQIRETRKFDCDNSKIGDSSHEEYPKKYPQVAKSGSTFYFCDFVYCPGIATEVNGSEGRKDSACSLYSHLEVAPEIIYDFASKPGSIARITMQGISRTHNFLRYLS